LPLKCAEPATEINEKVLAIDEDDEEESQAKNIRRARALNLLESFPLILEIEKKQTKLNLSDLSPDEANAAELYLTRADISKRLEGELSEFNEGRVTRTFIFFLEDGVRVLRHIHTNQEQEKKIGKATHRMSFQTTLKL
jgi:hypothetical protein